MKPMISATTSNPMLAETSLEAAPATVPARSTLISIVGPTGSGKTDLAVALAMRLGAPIVSTDSRQVYRGMKIGSAQPTDEQLAAVPHYFIADREPTERFSCADFEREALALLDKLFAEHKFVIAVGGSGLYVDALLNGLDALPDVDHELRKELVDRLSCEGLQPLLEELERLDPGYYATVDRQNPARVTRALEVCLQTGKPFSSFRTGTSLHAKTLPADVEAKTPRPGAKAKARRPFDVVKIGVDIPRPELYARIDRRVEKMMAAGLEAEARELYPLKHLPALQTVGYRELFAHFDAEVADDGEQTNGREGAPGQAEGFARAVELIKRNSRRYAKRQLTWFRRDGEIKWFHPAETGEIIDHINKKIFIFAT